MIVISTMLLGMICTLLPLANSRLLSLLTPSAALDFTAFYPVALYKNQNAPLHFLVDLKTWYLSQTGDPFFATGDHEPWFHSFLYIELLVQFPLAAYLVYNLSSAKSADSVEVELAGLVFGCVTAMGSIACCFHIHAMNDFATKSQLLWGTYFPFSVIRKSPLT